MKSILIILVSVFTAGIAAAQQPVMTAKVSPLGCTTTLGSNTFTALSSSLSVTNSGVFNASDLTLQKLQDSCTPRLSTAFTAGTHYDSLTLSSYDGAGVLLLEVTLYEVTVSSYKAGDGTESPGFSFSKIQVLTYFPNERRFCYDFQSVRSC
jgi:hypothetical protein